MYAIRSYYVCPVLIINGPLTEIKKILIAIQNSTDVENEDIIAMYPVEAGFWDRLDIRNNFV